MSETSTGPTIWEPPARVQRLRDRALAHDWGSFGDRGALVTQVLADGAELPRPLQIARALQAVCEQMPLAIAEDELVIGRRTMLGYPEHDEAIAAGSAEPGYMIADYPRVLKEGLGAIRDDLQARLAAAAGEQAVALESMLVACEATLRLAERHAEAAEALAAGATDPQRRAELLELARLCRTCPAQPASTFHEAVQSLWLTHLAVYVECENVAFSLGRMDQYLDPFYQADLVAGRIDAERARELLACLWVKLYENVRGGIGHVQTVTVGGSRLAVGSDQSAVRAGPRPEDRPCHPEAEEGHAAGPRPEDRPCHPEGEQAALVDATNDVTWLIQEVTRALSNVGPSVASRVQRATPDDYLRYVLETMALGRYMPQLYNDDQMIPALQSKGIPAVDACEYGLIGCHEPTICGQGYFRSASWPGYVCFQDWLERALGNGCSLLDGRRDGCETGEPETLTCFEELWAALLRQMAYTVQQRVEAANRGEEVKAGLTPRPLLSALLRDCASKGRDFTAGGARYNLSGFQAFGLGTCVDALCAIRRFVYEEGVVALPELVAALRGDWAGAEGLRRRMEHESPHWGTGEPAADELGVALVAALQQEIARYTNARGGPFALGLWSFWNHVGHGKVVAASADGRHHGEMLSHSMDPGNGRACAGPTGAVRSAAAIDTSGLANGGSLLLEFQPRLLREAAGQEAVLGLIRTYFALGGIQLQLSAVTAEQLEAAVREPDKHRDLVVRVAGYCDYFVRQDEDRQAYILAREKHRCA